MCLNKISILALIKLTFPSPKEIKLRSSRSARSVKPFECERLKWLNVKLMEGNAAKVDESLIKGSDR